MNLKAIFLIVYVLLFTQMLQAQLPGACGGGSSPAIACEEACVFCNFQGYTGSTAGYPSGIVPEFCGTVENAQWLGFIAGDDTATFTIQPFNCSDGNGVQVALYEDCTMEPLACDKGEFDGGNTPVSITIDMIPGRNYFLMIDGFAGDNCEFTVSISPVEAVYEPPLGVVSTVTGPPEVCAGATMQYDVLPVSGAGGYIWDGPPGTLINGEPVPAVAGISPMITFGDQSGNICVQAANSCSVNPPCSASMFVEILPESARPQITGDTSAHLNCLDSPVTLDAMVEPSTLYEYSWTVDSIGTILSGSTKEAATTDVEGVYTFAVRNPVNGCTNTADFTVGPPELPAAGLLDIRHVRCYGFTDGRLDISNMELGVAPYLYSVDSLPFTQMPTIQFLPAGDHVLLIEDAFGCEWDTVFTVEQPEELIVSLPEDTTIHLGQTIRLMEDSYVNFPSRVMQTTASPDFLNQYLCDTCEFCPINSIRYTIAITDSAGCRSEDKREIIVENDRLVYVPNAFQPDNFSDGNERLRVFCGEDVMSIRRFQIYDRWGQMVFDHGPYDPYDASVAWDGTHEGKKLVPGVFLYYLEIDFKDGASEVFRGDVTLVR